MELKTIANLGRLKDIVVVLLKHGFEDLVDRLDLPGKNLIGKIHKEEPHRGTPERIRRALEELGPTFIKLGQIMSLRPDLLPQPLIRELGKLHDEVAPVEFAKVRKVVEKSLQGPLEETFCLFDEAPVAAASLSQVHRAVLCREGRVVAAKVQRPDIRETVERDFNILEIIARHVHERLEEARIYGFPDLVRLARKTLERELDFRREARHMKIARMNLKDTPGVYVPEALDEYSTPDLLVMEFIEGKKLKEMDPLELDNPEIMARHGLQATIQQVMKDGFFHADPHTGNLLIAKDMTLCLLDWGMVGRLTEEDRFELIDLVNAVVERNSRKLVDCLLSLTRSSPDLSRRELERSLVDILDAYLGVPVKEIRLGQFVMDVTDLMHEYRLRLPPDMFMLSKAIMTSEATASILFPNLNVIAEAEPFIRRIVLRRYRPDVLVARFAEMAYRLLALRGKLPVRMARIVEKLEKGQLHIRFEHENLEGLRHTVEYTFNRLTFGVIIGAMIIGSSMVITTGVGPYLFGYPALGILGYLISAVLGMWLIVSIIRTRRY